MAAPLSDGPEITQQAPENGDNHRSEGDGTLRGQLPEFFIEGQPTSGVARKSVYMRQ
jgi:hypothetical protein